ncbi:MAG: helix-turn-helix domain-containing protein [Inhella sp.]
MRQPPPAARRGAGWALPRRSVLPHRRPDPGLAPLLRQRSDFEASAARILRELAGADAPLAPDVADALRRALARQSARAAPGVLRGAWALLEPGEREIGWVQLPELVPAEPQPAALPPTGPHAARPAGAGAARGAGRLRRHRSEAARRLGISRSSLYRALGGEAQEARGHRAHPALSPPPLAAHSAAASDQTGRLGPVCSAAPPCHPVGR